MKAKRVQTGRLIKVICPACGCIGRFTRVWLDTVGSPFCGCGNGKRMREVPTVAQKATAQGKKKFNFRRKKIGEAARLQVAA